MTGVSECSQQRGNLKDDGYIPVRRQSGIYPRYFGAYGHIDHRYLRKALENAYPDITPKVLPDWNHDENLLGFLNNL
ncbi:hypothetical protein [Photorhabdus bodei]|uniref:Uncharacterized protein n=1 Tax=Photorhabdus bodei TaxID=2029681 RepID=A0ABX0AK05_9GAMM|nr:hypothetical protein [Photorhabdus bodei]NDK98989.1 hypothetical protein [Photorhabdus bodei]NDL03333.1 hypothetical protein [Photorhabdus bodei]NDL07447.1 hypothetical protein [Photorhabdus bodei]